MRQNSLCLMAKLVFQSVVSPPSTLRVLCPSGISFSAGTPPAHGVLSYSDRAKWRDPPPRAAQQQQRPRDRPCIGRAPAGSKQKSSRAHPGSIRPLRCATRRDASQPLPWTGLRARPAPLAIRVWPGPRLDVASADPATRTRSGQGQTRRPAWLRTTWSSLLSNHMDRPVYSPAAPFAYRSQH
jgi:hypothetical protein